MTSDIFFKKVKLQLEHNLPFVCKSQNHSLKAYLQSDDVLVELKNFNSSGFVFCPFSKPNQKVIFPESKLEVIESKLKPETITTHNQSIEEIQEDKLRHIQLVDKAIKYIKTGLADKIVCSRKIKFLKQVSPIETFIKLAQIYPDAYSYCWYHPKIGLWVGATPEQFINLDRNLLKTVALAGTQDVAEFPEPNWREKEKEEQQMVTDYIVETLEKYSDEVKIKEVENIRAGNLWHLKTRLSAQITPNNLSPIIKDLHPTSAVCGLPQAKAKSFILDYENYNREYYSGFLGELNMKTFVNRKKQSLNQEQLAIRNIKTVSDLYVNLRCMKVYDQHVEIFVGGGITGDSEPKAEYLETVAKSQTLLNVL